MAVVYYAPMVQETSATIVQAELVSITTCHGFRFTVGKPVIHGDGTLDPSANVAAIFEYPDPSEPDPEPDGQGNTPVRALTMYRIISFPKDGDNAYKKGKIGLATYVRRADVVRWDWFFPEEQLRQDVKDLTEVESQDAQQMVDQRGAKEPGADGGSATPPTQPAPAATS